MKTTRFPNAGTTRTDRLFCAVALLAALTSLPPCVGSAQSTRSVAAAGTEIVVSLHDDPDLRSADRAE